MGQAWKVVNLDKKESLFAHKFDEGYKFLEFGFSCGGTMSALAVLLAAPESMGHGGGDLDTRGPEIGRWVGDRVVVLGEYNDDPKYAGVYKECVDISERLHPYLND